MSSFKHTFRRVMSVVLSCAMLCGFIGMFSLISFAADAKLPSQESSELTFVVPESIYLNPSPSSTAFEYYMNNKSTGAVEETTNDTTGKIYYSLTNAGSATLSYSFIDSSFSSAGTGSISLSNSTITNGGSVNITAGSAPSASSCYVQWVLSYTDPADNVAKNAYAYSYIYKPYYYPVFASTRCYNERGVESDMQSMAWIAGIHSADSNSDRGINTTNFAPLSGTLTVPTNTKNDGGYSQDTTTYHSGDNTPKTGKFQNYSAGTGDGNVSSQAVSPTGYITVDISRTPNFNQIPNFKIGHLISYVNEGSASTDGRWYGHYLSDFSSTYSSSFTSGTQKDKTFYTDNRGTYIVSDISKEEGNDASREYCRPRLVYHNAWNKAVPSSSGTIAIKGASRFGTKKDSNDRNSSANNSNICHVDVTVYNKGNLRTAVNNATKKMAALGVTGISSGNLTSKYFDANNDYKWNSFQTAYRNAVLALCKVDGTITDPDTLAANLNNALAALHTKVTLNANRGSLNNAQVGGTNGSGYVQIGANQTVSVTPGGTPTRGDGYTFNGWSLTVNPATGTQGSNTVTVGYNNTLYACWTANQFTITCDAAGGTNAADNPTSYDIETSVTLKAPSRTGYTFTGWTGDNGSTPQTTVTIPAGQTGDKSYTANWEANKYTVVYEKGADSATGSVASTNAEYDRSFTVPANGFTNEGHTFTGWKGQNNVTYQPGDTPKNLTAAANGTFTMTAQWSVNSYNVVYDNMLDMQEWQQNVESGNQISISDKTDTGFTATSTGGNDGYTNWSPAMEVEAGKQYVVESNMVGSGYEIFAEWLNSSDAHVGDFVSFTDVQSPTFTAPANAAKMRIRFDANDSGNSITCSDVRVAKVDDDPLLNRSNVTVSRSGKLYNYGSDYTSDLPSASRTGYEFAGWYTDYDATTPVVSGSTVSDSTLHLWSKWTQNVYNISYSMDGGTNHADNPASYTVENEIILKAPEKQGYDFTGWTGSNGTTPQTSVTIPKGSTGNRNYTANWSIKTFTVIFDCANDTPASTHYVQYNNAVNTLKPVNPEKESTAQFSYTFTGWVSDTGTVYGPNDTLPAATADVTYTAQYSQTTRTYTVYWKNSDGSELETDMNVPYGTVPAYNEADPAKAPDEQYQYTWSGWESGGQTYLKTDTLPAIEGDTIFTATYTHATRQYTVTWYDEDRTTVLDTQTEDHGTSVTYGGNPPTKQGNAQYSYSFNTFKDDNGTAYPSDAAFTLNGDISLYAFYTQSINKYTVTWVGAAGNLEVDENVPYGTAPSFDLNGGRNPTKEQTDAATYEFSGWKSSVTGETYATVSLLPPVTGKVTFTAQFEEHVRQYNVSWKNWNGDALGADLLDYGAVPAYSGTETPARTPTTTKEYVFAGWRSSGGTQYPAGTALPQVTGAETYTAYYTEQVRMYTVRWVDENGYELEVDTKAYAYNDHPTYDSGESLIPVKTDTDEYHYEWGGWRDTVSGSSYTPASLVAARVTKDTTYQVWYKAIKKQYTVTWIIRDSNGAETIGTTEVDYGVSPTHEEPEYYVVNEGGSDYYYTFSGWKSNGTLYSPTDTLPIVTGQVTYTAEYARGTHRHHFVAGDITVEPTCTETGTQTWYCDYSGGCNETFEQTVDALGHLWDEGTVDRAPTCVATGTKLYHCTRNGCGATKTEVIAKDTVNGHKWIKDDDLSTEPSCEYTGTYYYHCEYNENHTKREIIPANGHAYTETVVAPTCVAQGYTLHVCSRCDRSYKDNYVEATGHDYDANEDGTVTTDDAVAVRQPDCINSGIWRYECKTCHTTHDELVPTLIDQLGDVPAAHRYHSEITRQATCTLGEKTTYECEVCHKSYSEDTHDPLGHNYDRNGDGVEDENDYDVIPATCTERGSVSKTCTRCGKTVRVENLPALRHDWGEGVVTQPATCAGDGIMTYTCTREGCGVTKTEVIPMTPDSHVYDGGVVTTPPTYSRTGLMTYTCTVCGHSYTEEIGRLERDDDDDPNHGGAGDAGNSGGNSTHHNSEGRCSMCDKYEAIQSSNSPGITKLFYSIVHFIVHLFATFSF